MIRCSLFIFTLIAATGVGASVLLEADFNDKTVNEAIGQGGASVGEPTMVTGGMTAIIRDTPMATNSLELADTSSGTGFARFDFLDLMEITTGQVSITADLWFSEIDEFTFVIRESETPFLNFAHLTFNSSGDVMYADGNSVSRIISTYAPGYAIPVRIEFNMDAGTLNLWFDGEQVVNDEAFGIADRGIGAVVIGIGHDPEALGTMYVDNLLATDPSLIFVDGFEAGNTDRWPSVVSQ